jgi:uncharacterized protein YjeT (DUF2065 family)
VADTFWTALALVLIFEGLLPFASPSRWRRMFSQMLNMRDGQIRFFGLISLLLGSLLWWWVT